MKFRLIHKIHDKFHKQDVIIKYPADCESNAHVRHDEDHEPGISIWEHWYCGTVGYVMRQVYQFANAPSQLAKLARRYLSLRELLSHDTSCP